MNLPEGNVLRAFPENAANQAGIMNVLESDVLRGAKNFATPFGSVGPDGTSQLFGNIAGKKLAVFGYAFKANTNDTRESPARYIIKYLLSEEVNSEMPIQNSMYSVLEGQDLPEEKGYLYHSKRRKNLIFLKNGFVSTPVAQSYS